MTLQQIFEKVATETGLPVTLVKSTYNCYWQFYRTKIQELPLKEDLSEEEFNKLKVNFNIPSIGKLYCSYNKYRGMKKRFEYIKNLKND